MWKEAIHLECSASVQCSAEALRTLGDHLTLLAREQHESKDCKATYLAACAKFPPYRDIVGQMYPLPQETVAPASKQQILSVAPTDHVTVITVDTVAATYTIYHSHYRL